MQSKTLVLMPLNNFTNYLSILNMIHGIGTDIVNTARIERLYKRYGDIFVGKILAQTEWLEWSNSPPSHPILFLSKRFAAKEAFAKAIHTGLRYPVTLHNIAVVHDKNGSPEFLCDASLQNLLKEQGITKVHLSLSDEQDYVLAFAIAEK